MVLQLSQALGNASLSALKRDAASAPQDEATLRRVAQQFESLLTQQVLKAARQTSLGDDLMGGAGLDLYQDLFDQQMAQQISAGQGLGFADTLVRQLRGTLTPSSAAPAAVAAPLASHSVPAREASAASMPDRIEDFVRQVWPHAERAAAALGLPTEAVVGHAGLETGWGAHLPGADSHNYFGLKAGSRWQGDAVAATTTEMDGGTARQEQARFRAYDSAAAGFAGYVDFLRGQRRYAEAIRPGNNIAAFAEGLQKAGYATDPAYAEKLKAAIASVVRAKPAI
jgi:flagellar protein FlgJ